MVSIKIKQLATAANDLQNPIALFLMRQVANDVNELGLEVVICAENKTNEKGVRKIINMGQCLIK